MAKYMLVSFKTCPWVQRSAIILREKNTPFEMRHIEPDNRPDWFLAISPHKKVPVLTVDDKISLFESNAINEYLDETVAPRLHPADPVERARNRAWTDYVPTFASAVTGCAYAQTEEAYKKGARGGADRLRTAGKALESTAPARSSTAQVFAGGRGLCAVPAALRVPRPHQEDRPDREIPAGQGLDRRADGAPLDPFLPGGRIRGDVPRGCAAPEELYLAVHRRAGGGGEVDGERAVDTRSTHAQGVLGLRFRVGDQPIETVLAAFNAAGPWQWQLRESAVYGDYRNRRPDAHVRLRVHEYPQTGEYGTFTGLRDKGFSALLKLYCGSVSSQPEIDGVFRRLLQAIDATNVTDIEHYD